MAKPKILIYDIETMANLAYVWAKWETNVIDYSRHWYMMSFAWKWLNEEKTRVCALPDYSIYKKDKYNDKMLVKELWRLFNEADIILAHNGRAFDIKKSNACFLKHSLPPPEPYKIIDTKEVAKRYFKFDSNSLNDLADFLHIGRKLSHNGFDMWRGCENGDKASWKNMCEYNKHDVVLLEKVYLAMLPYMNNHPNVGLWTESKIACPNCGDENMVKQGQRRTRTSMMQQYQCKSCGSWASKPAKEGSQMR